MFNSLSLGETKSLHSAKLAREAWRGEARVHKAGEGEAATATANLDDSGARMAGDSGG